jgi:hypothetical protein
MSRSICHLSCQIQTTIHHSRIVGNLLRTLYSAQAQLAMPSMLGPGIRFVPFYAAWQGLKQSRWVLLRTSLPLHCTCCIVTILCPCLGATQILLPYHMTRSPIHFITSESAARSDRCAACVRTVIYDPAQSCEYDFHFLLIDLRRWLRTTLCDKTKGCENA